MFHVKHALRRREMMSDVLKTSGQYRVRLEQDSDPVNPREDYDHVTYVVTVPDSHYVDVAGPGPLSDRWDHIKHRSDAVDLFTRWARISHSAVVEHHTPNNGPVSVWYMLPEGIAEVTNPLEYLRGDVQEYQNWADGEVYGYIIEKSVEWERADGEDETRTTWEEVEDGSCWGLIGFDYAAQAAEEALSPYESE
jgi:hypothetical protein